MAASNYLRGKIIDHVLRGVAFASPATVYVSLHTSDPTVNGTPATEVAAAWYGRLPITFAAQSTAGITSNSNTVTFNPVTGAGVTVTHFAVWDAQNIGNMLAFGALSANKSFAVTDVPTWLPGQLSHTQT